MSNRALTAADERLARPGDYLCEETWAEAFRRDHPQEYAAARRRNEKQAEFYRAHPRTYGALARFPLWRRW